MNCIMRSPYHNHLFSDIPSVKKSAVQEVYFIFSFCSNRYNKLGLNQRTTFRMQVKSLWNKVCECVCVCVCVCVYLCIYVCSAYFSILQQAKLEVSCQLKPSSVKGLSKHRVIDMSLGPTHSAVIVEGGRVVTFGRNSEGQLGCGSMNCKSTPGVVTSVEGKGRTMVSISIAIINYVC